MKKACLVVYDPELSEYEIVELLPNKKTNETDLKLVEFVVESFPMMTRKSWKDTLEEIEEILEDRED